MADMQIGPVAFGNPKFYFNGFQLGLSNADITGTLLLDNVPVCGINMSYTTAKTLQASLSSMIETLERVTERKIMTINEVAIGMEKLGSGAAA